MPRPAPLVFSHRSATHPLAMAPGSADLSLPADLALPEAVALTVRDSDTSPGDPTLQPMEAVSTAQVVETGKRTLSLGLQASGDSGEKSSQRT